MVSASFGMLCFGICRQLNIPNEEWYGLFVYASTFITYNAQRLLKLYPETVTSTYHMQWVAAHKKELSVLIAVHLFIGGFSFFEIYHGNEFTLILLFLSALISLLYVLKLKGKSLRDRSHLKIHVIALICTIATGPFVLVNETDYDPQKWLFVLIHYIYFVAVTIPFDIRDLKYDHPRQRTIPQVVGARNAKIISILLLSVYLVLALLFLPQLRFNYIYLLTITWTLILLIGMKESRTDFYCSGWVESSIFLVGVGYALT